MGSNPENSLLQKFKERLHTQDLRWSDPYPDPAQVGAICTELPFYILYVTLLYLYLTLTYVTFFFLNT
jgi:hypothetical protein